MMIVVTCTMSFCLEKNPNKIEVQKEEKISHASIGNGMTESKYDEWRARNTTTVFQSENFACYYFKNLTENFGNNVYGTCTYVSLQMLLSFYDTYWDDNFVPDIYEVCSDFVSTSQDNYDFELLPFDTASPGVVFERNALIRESIVDGENVTYQNYPIEKYYQLIDQYSEKYFHLKLLQLSKSYFGSIKFDQSYHSLGMTYAEMIAFLNYYLYDYLSFKTSDVKIISENSSQNAIKAFVIEKIKNGIPVILRTSDFGGHSFIAYDYDEMKNQVYVHAGLRDEVSSSALTHISLGDFDNVNVWDATAIQIQKKHSHSNNYHSSNGKNFCSCNYIFPQNIEMVSGNYRDTLPTFQWKSLYKEKWYTQYSPYFELSILDAGKRQLFENKIKNQKSYILNQTEWDRLLVNSTDHHYYISIRLDSEIYPYWDEYWSTELFDKPEDYNEIPIIKPNEYGFGDAYPTDGNTKENFIEHNASNDFTFRTRRYRTGYIHNEYIVMSPIRRGIRQAFIEYQFDRAITRLDVQLSHWRNYASEGLNENTGKAELQQYIGDEWVTQLDLLSSESNLPTERSRPQYYSVFFERPAYRIRFYSESYTENTNDSNKGRICIGNMAFYPSKYSLPLSGYELDYQPSQWNNYDAKNYNCYAYALNTKNYDFISPGGSEGYNSRNTPNYFTAPVLEEMVRLDANNYHFQFEPIGKNDVCDKGFYKVALVVDPNRQDYHWYRQNSDGSWSHKHGANSVINYDYINDVIYDPETCDRRYDDGLNYSEFIGFYQVNINNMI